MDTNKESKSIQASDANTSSCTTSTPHNASELYVPDFMLKYYEVGKQLGDVDDASLEQYFERINYDGSRDSTIETLIGILTNHAFHIPYDAMDA